MRRSLLWLAPLSLLPLSAVVCSQAPAPIDVTQPPPEGRVDEWIDRTLAASAEVGPQARDVTEQGPDLGSLRREWDRQAASAEVQAVLGGHDYTLLEITGPRPAEKAGETGEPANAFHVLIHDYTTNKAWLFDSNVGAAAPRNIGASVARPLPTLEEYARAEQLIRQTPGFGPAIRGGLVKLSRPMPGLVADAARRSILFELSPSNQGRVAGFTRGRMGVDLGAASLLKPDSTLVPVTDVTTPESAMLTVSASTCGGEPEDQRDGNPFVGDQAVTMNWGQWSFRVIRPSASSPTSSEAPGGAGGGVELRAVAWKGRLVLNQAHVPILNVKYPQVPCDVFTTFRDGVSGEVNFQTDLPGTGNGGVVFGTAAPRTMWSNPPTDDSGNFSGVWIWEEPGKLSLLSVLASGHYRYLTKWSFYSNGMLKPEFGFAATHNECTCNKHTHHAYWRLDFDVNGASRNVIHKTTNNGSTWALYGNGSEARDYRQLFDSNYTKYYYRVTGPGGYKVLLKPGIYDQSTRNVAATADYRQGGYADGDVWGVTYKVTELLDDPINGDGEERTKAKVQTFVNGESINNADVVIWYGAHMSHAGSEHSSPSSTVGPTIIASW